MNVPYHNPLAGLDALLPFWLQIPLFGYLGIVLTQWAVDQLAERRLFLVFLIYLSTGVFCVIRAVQLLMAHLH